MKSKLWTKTKTLLAAAGLLLGALFGATAVCQLDKENALPVYAEEVQEEVTQEDALVRTWDISPGGNGSVKANLYEYADNAGTYYLEISGMGNMMDWSSSRPWYNYRTTIDKVTIDSGITSIGKYAFYDCSNLTSIDIPNSVILIGQSAFQNCNGLTGVYITDITAWHAIAFNGPNSNPLYYAKNLYINNQLITELVIPDSVTSIGQYAFINCSSLTSIKIPNSVTSIGREAFYCCRGLTSVEIPNSVTLIDNTAFCGCDSLTSIEIPDSVTTIGNSVFYGCDSLTSIEIPDSVTTIGNSVFYDCSSLTSIIIGSGVTTIGKEMFRNCSSLTSVEIPDSVTTIEDAIFYNCSGLTSVTIGSGVTTIGGNVFFNCIKLTSIEIPDSVTSIEDYGKYMFYGCKSLTNVIIGDGVTSICGDMFYDCGSLVSVTIGNGVTSIESQMFYFRGSLMSVTIGNGVTTIGNSAFNGCSSLTNITIGNGVTTIGNSVFYSCGSLTSVEIPNSVTTIGDSAFRDCSKLSKITFLSKTTTIYDSAYTISDTATIYGYTGSTAEAYATKYNRNFVALKSYDSCAFIGTNVTLGADITVNYYVNLDEANADLQMRITMNDKSVVVDGEATGIVSDGLTRYVFRFTGVAPQYIGDNILAEWFAVDGESEITVLTKDNYSVKSYCEALLTYSASDLGMTDMKYAAMETLVADLLHYGSAAQVYTEYKTDTLVDKDAVGGSDFATLEETDEELIGGAMEGVSFYMATVFFDNVNTIRIQIKADDIGKVSMLVCRNGVPVAICTEFSALGENTYAVETEGILATEFGDLFTFTVYINGVQGQSFVYSVNSYAYSMQNDGNTAMANLAKATYNYGASAKRYSFTK